VGQQNDLPKAGVGLRTRRASVAFEELEQNASAAYRTDAGLVGAPFRVAGERPASVAEGRAGSTGDLRGEGGDCLGQDRLCAGNV